MTTEVKPGARIQESCTTIMGMVIDNNTMSMSGSSRGLILSKPWYYRNDILIQASVAID